MSSRHTFAKTQKAKSAEKASTRPGSSQGIFLQADRYYDAGRYAEAIPLLETLTANLTLPGRESHMLAQCHALLGRHEKAIRVYEAAEAKSPDDPRWPSLIGSVLSDCG